MRETKSLCAKIPLELHNKVREKQEESGVTLNQYVEQIITQYYEMKEMNPMEQKRTLALQITFSIERLVVSPFSRGNTGDFLKRRKSEQTF